MDRVDKTVYFSGDSFTFGEGLELFTPTEKWKNELNSLNDWSNLKNKVDLESSNYRKNNNFSGLFQKHFQNYNVIVDDENGGSLSWNLQERILPKLNKIGNVDYLIIQFTSFKRNLYHLNNECKCDFCNLIHRYTTLDLLFGDSYDFIEHKKLKKNHISNYDVDRINNFFNYLNINPENKVESLDKIETFYFDTIKMQIELFKDKYLNFFKKNGISVYFIDSWEPVTSSFLNQDLDINNLLIPLISTNGNRYKSWPQWISTLDKPFISDLYPKTGNQHPTPKTHILISESLIDFFNKNNVFS